MNSEQLLKKIAQNTSRDCCCSPGTKASSGSTASLNLVASGSSTIIAPSATDQIRAIEIIPISGGTPGTGTNGLATIEITKSDGSVLTFQFRQDMVWNYQGSISSAPITSVDITNDDGATAFDFIINVSSI